MNHRSLRIPWNRSGFTLLEVLVAATVMAAVGLGAYSLLNTGLVLYAKNYSINNTHYDGRASLEKIADRIHAAAGAPTLVDDTGAKIGGDGPAAGVRFARFTTSGFFIIPSDVSATATSFAVQFDTNQEPPKKGDIVMMSDLGLQAPISSASGSGGTRTLYFPAAVGTFLPRKKTSGNAITSAANPDEARCHILQQAAFIAVNSQLRYYPSAMTVADDGPGYFNMPTKFEVVTSLLPPAGQQSLPFSYSDPNRQSLDVNLRVESRQYNKRGYQTFLTFSSLHTTVAFRSATFIE